MHPELLAPADPATPLSRKPKYVISIDLGSDSTVVYVKSNAEAERDPEAVRLQYFLPALARRPALLLDGNGVESHRLRSRYLQNHNFRVQQRLQIRTTAEGFEEILPPGHATTRMLDFERFEQQVAFGAPGQNHTNCAQNKQAILYQFVVDQSETFALADLLPNAKLAFQSGLKPRSFRATVVENGEESIQSFDLHPLEMIQNQICLVLENFVRHHPSLRPRGGEVVAWEDCLVILTVPNTYSPFHREQLGAAVARTLGCQIRTITESDAIVFHYYSTHPVNQNMTGNEVEKLVQQYLTIDIGKGTTDLTLMSITLRQGSPEELAKRGIQNPNAKLPHVYVSARTGRPSGGAKLTHIIAEYLEKVIDLAVKRATTEYAAKNPAISPLEESPIRMTTLSRSDLPPELVRNALLSFETVCDAHKRQMDVVIDRGGDEHRFARLQIPEISGVAAAIAEVAVQVMDPTRMLLSSFSARDGESFEHEIAVAKVVDEVSGCLAEPNQFLANDGALKNPLWDSWTELQKKIAAYVRENVDDVLIELARAHYDNVADNELRNGVDALDVIAGEKSRRLLRVGLPADMQMRTHVIIAGQASQFKPILLHIRKLLSKARYINTNVIVDDEGEPLAITPIPAVSKKGVFSKIANASRHLMATRIAPGYEPDQDRVVLLTGSNLKDGCARGALAWWLANPILEKPELYSWPVSGMSAARRRLAVAGHGHSERIV